MSKEKITGIIFIILLILCGTITYVFCTQTRDDDIVKNQQIDLREFPKNICGYVLTGKEQKYTFEQIICIDGIPVYQRIDTYHGKEIPLKVKLDNYSCECGEQEMRLFKN